MLNRLPEFHQSLLSWYFREKRDLPWRKTSDPYHIWISEVMLQQTQVSTVIPYYETFIKQFPTITGLAQANLEAVLKCWEGLGYYSRARNLHAAARLVSEQYEGILPSTLAQLKKLPGIGDYTAAAILSIAFGIPTAAVDGNIKRVFARLMMTPDPVNHPGSSRVYRAMAEKMLHKDKPGDYNQALMELGALICKPKNPSCDDCPLTDLCLARNSRRVADFPVAVKKPKSPTYKIAVAVITKGDLVLITKRDEKGLLGGLWEFPGGKLKAGENPEEACIREAREETGLQIELVSHLTQVKHAYTHFKIEMDVFVCRFLSGRVSLSGPVDYKWIRLDQVGDFPFPRANHKFIPLLGSVVETSP